MVCCWLAIAWSNLCTYFYNAFFLALVLLERVPDQRFFTAGTFVHRRWVYLFQALDHGLSPGWLGAAPYHPHPSLRLEIDLYSFLGQR